VLSSCCTWSFRSERYGGNENVCLEQIMRAGDPKSNEKEPRPYE
jgi:hypothetical protein